MGERNGKTARLRAARARALSANMEDYLEAIYRLADGQGVARVSNIADALAVKRPSVSKALKRLRDQGLVRHSPYGDVGMTERGRTLARQQVHVHRVLTRFLTEVLKMPVRLAEHDACLIEHAISQETVARLVEFIHHLEAGGRGGRAFRTRAGAPPRVPITQRAWQSKV